MQTSWKQIMQHLSPCSSNQFTFTLAGYITQDISPSFMLTLASHRQFDGTSQPNTKQAGLISTAYYREQCCFLLHFTVMLCMLADICPTFLNSFNLLKLLFVNVDFTIKSLITIKILFRISGNTMSKHKMKTKSSMQHILLKLAQLNISNFVCVDGWYQQDQTHIILDSRSNQHH